jgi:hypothetical protein
MQTQQSPICQSCAMPLASETDLGTNQDQTKSEEYCFHCFKDGKFLDQGITLQGKIEKNIKFGIQMGMQEDEARQMCESILPNLKRWNAKL